MITPDSEGRKGESSALISKVEAWLRLQGNGLARETCRPWAPQRHRPMLTVPSAHSVLSPGGPVFGCPLFFTPFQKSVIFFCSHLNANLCLQLKSLSSFRSVYPATCVTRPQGIHGLELRLSRAETVTLLGSLS